MKTHEHLKGSGWLRSLWRMLCAVLLVTLLGSVLQISDAGAQDRVVSRDLGGALTKGNALADARAELANAESALTDARLKQQVAQKSLGDARTNLQASQSGVAVAQDDLVRLNAELTVASGAVESQANAVSEAKAALAAASDRVVAATKASASAQTAVEQQARSVADLSAATPNLEKAQANLALAQRTLSERSTIARNAAAESTKAQQVALEADADVAVAKAAAPTPEAISKAEAAVVAATTDLRTSQSRLADAVAKGAKDTKDLEAAVTRAEGLLIAAQNTRAEMAGAAERLAAAERNLATASKQALVQEGAALDANAAAKLASQDVAKAERAVVEAEASAAPLDEAQTRLTLLESEAAEARAAVVAAENEMVLAEQRMELAQDSLTSATGAREKLVTQTGELTKAIETAKKTIAEAPAKIASLDKQAVAAAEVVKSAEASVATLAVKVRDLEGVPAETTVNRTAVVGSKLAPIARIVDANPVRVAVTDGAVPLGAKLAEDGSFTGAPSKAGEALTRVMVTDTVTNDRELRTINWTITQKPALETSVDRSAVLGSELPAILPIFPESLTTVELIEGELPAGVKLAADGSFSGLTSRTGKFQATVMVTDVPTGDRELRTVTWTVAEKPAAKTTVDRAAVRGSELAPVAPIVPGNPVRVALAEGVLPAGVKLAEDGSFTGTPSKAGDFTATVMVTDTVTNDRELRTINWTITEKAPVETTVDRTSVAGDELGPITRIDAENPITVAIVDGELPRGVKLGLDGELLGAPQKACEAMTKVLITDSVTGDREIRTINWTISEKPAVETVVDRSAVRDSKLAPIARIDAKNPVTVELLEGELPTGVKMAANGSLSGVPAKVGEAISKVMVTDSVTGDREIRTINWTITEKAPVVSIAEHTAPRGSELAPIAPIDAKNPATVEQLDGDLPEGIKLGADGTLSGTATKVGDYTAKVIVTDTVTGDRDERTITWSITPKDIVETEKDRSAVRGSELAALAPIDANNPITVSIVDGSLPRGVTLGENGTLLGAPEKAGAAFTKVLITDTATTDREVRSINWTITEKSPTETVKDRSAVRGSELAPISRIDDENPVRVELLTGALPTGIKLAEGGTLVGNATTAESTTSKVMVTDMVTNDREIRTINWTITPKAVVEMTTERSGVRGSELAPIGRIVADNPVRVELLEGALPDGVKMAEDGGLRGTPTKVGETTSKVLITDVVTGDREERTITWTIAEKDPVKTAEEHSAPRGSELAPIAPVEGENPVRVEVLDGELPEGIKLSEDGSLDGTATKVGEYTATVMVTDTKTGDREERSITWSITPKDIVKTTEDHTSVRDAELDAIAPIDAKNPVTVSLLEGQLPNGVSLGDNGALEGPATDVGDYTATVMVTDTVTTDREERTITWTITDKDPVKTTEVHTSVREAELAPIAPIADDNPVTVELLDGELPDGVELDEDGSLDGAATKVGDYTATIMVTDTKSGDREERTITWTIAAKDIVKTSTERAGVRDAKLAPIAPIADDNPVTVELLDGELPAGVELDDDGALTGAPTTVGDTTSTVLVTDTVTTDREKRTITWTIVDKDAVEKSVDASTTRTGTFDSIAPVYEDSDVTVELLEGDLPTGISMDDDGTFTGDATEVDEYTAKIMVTDTATGDRELRTYTWVVNPKPTAKSTHDFSAVREATLAPLAALDDENPIAAELVEGDLPDGVKLAKDGDLDGTANRTGDYTATVLVTDTVTLDSELRSITWRIAPKPISGSIEQHEATRKVALPAVQRIADNPITATVTAGSLPAGVELREDGTMTGSPDQAGTYRYTVLVTDSMTGDRESRAVSLTVSEKEATEVSEVMAATRKEALAPLKRIAAENPVTAELTAGSLPIGIDLMPDGSFDGTPDQAGTSNAMIMVTDEVTAERELRSVSFVVADKDATITNSQRTADIGDSIDDLKPINSGNGVTADLVGGSLPDGITLASDGSFNGKIASAGAYSAAIMVTDNETAERELRTVDIMVLPAPDTMATSRTAKVGAALAPLARVASSNPITAELVSGTLPPGVSLSSSGAFEGTSTTAGSWTVDIMVTDTTTGNRELRTVSFQLNAASAATRVTYSGTTYSGAAGTFTTGSTGSTSTSRDTGSTSTRSTTAPSGAQARSTGTSIFGEAPDLLAFTGASTTRLAGVGGALVLVGAMALVASKRKDDDET